MAAAADEDLDLVALVGYQQDKLKALEEFSDIERIAYQARLDTSAQEVAALTEQVEALQLETTRLALENEQLKIKMQQNESDMKVQHEKHEREKTQLLKYAKTRALRVVELNAERHRWTTSTA